MTTTTPAANSATTNDLPPEAKLRSNTQGPVRTPKAQRNAILDELEKSGLSCLAFSRLVGVKYPTLMNWVMKRRQERRPTAGGDAELGSIVEQKPTPAVKVRLFEALAEVNDRSGAALEVELPGGARVHVSTRQQAELAAMLLRAVIPFDSSCKLFKRRTVRPVLRDRDIPRCELFCLPAS